VGKLGVGDGLGEFGLREEDAVGGGGDEAEDSSTRGDVAGESPESGDEGVEEDASFKEGADVWVEVREVACEDDVLCADEVDGAGDDDGGGVDGAGEPGLDAAGGDVGAEGLPGGVGAFEVLSEGGEESLSGDERLETADGAAHARAAVAVDACVPEFAGHGERSLKELASGDECTADAVAEVHEDEGLVGREVGGRVGLVAEGEGLDFLDGAGGGVEEVGEPVEEAGLFDDGEVWRAENAVGVGVEDAWDADEENVGGRDVESSASGVDACEEGLDGAWCGEGD